MNILYVCTYKITAYEKGFEYYLLCLKNYLKTSLNANLPTC